MVIGWSSPTNTLSFIDTKARLWSIFFLFYLQAIKRLGGPAMHQECLDLKVKTLDQTNQEMMLEIRSLKQSVEALQIMQEDPIPWNIRSNLNNS